MRNSDSNIFLNEYDLNEADAVLLTLAKKTYLRGEVSTALSNRLESKIGALEAGLKKLKKQMGDANFIRLIEPLEKVTLSGKKVLLIAPTEMHRSLLEREFIPDIQKAFDVDLVRIVARR